MNISQATSFLKRSLSSPKDFGAVDTTRQEAKRVDSELGRIEQDTVDIQKELSQTDESSKLKPPSFKDVSNKDLVVATTAGGAVLGGAIGVLNAVASGPSSVSFNEVQHDILSPKLDGAGFDIHVAEVGDASTLRGWDVDITRKPLVNEKVGTYTTREPVAGASSSVLLSGALGLGIGAAVGAGVGVLGIGLRKALKQDYSGAEPRQTEGDAKILITSGVVGATVGAAAGAVSSFLGSHTVTYETQSPIIESNKVIGHIPHGANVSDGGFYIPNSSGNTPPANANEVVKLMNGNIDRLGSRDGYKNTADLRPDEVRADVPKTNILGNPKLDTEKKTVNVGPGMIGSVVGGAVIGGVTGVAGGVLLNVLRKTL